MIYLDNAATRKPFKCALDAYVEISNFCYGNPSSYHDFGFQALKKLDEAREGILSLLDIVKTHKLVFTSGATESNNLAIKGISNNYSSRGKKIITSLGEHPSVLEAFKKLELGGFEVVYLNLTEDGTPDLNQLSKEIDNQTILVSLMAVNNETGAITNVSKAAEIIHKFPKCFLHVDFTQGLGKESFDYNCADLISFSSHKFGGLKGNGCLILKKQIKLSKLNDGGGQEDGLRAGTVNVAGAYSTYIALKTELSQFENNLQIVKNIRQKCIDFISFRDDITLNSPINGSNYILNFSLTKKKASVVVEALSEKGIYVSSVSACSSKKEPISNVLFAMGKTKEEAGNAIRISFSAENTEEEIDCFLKELDKLLKELKDR